MTTTKIEIFMVIQYENFCNSDGAPPVKLFVKAPYTRMPLLLMPTVAEKNGKSLCRKDVIKILLFRVFTKQAQLYMLAFQEYIKV
jgi:hypothetical protein